MTLSPITDQAEVVGHNLQKVGKIFAETVVIVMGVVVVFLGWRAGLVTSVIVPLTVLGTLLVMSVLGIELHQISIAAIIIALGIFVDNAIVVVEDYQRRIEMAKPPNPLLSMRARLWPRRCWFRLWLSSWPLPRWWPGRVKLPNTCAASLLFSASHYSCRCFSP